jgi:hypothetical protein
MLLLVIKLNIKQIRLGQVRKAKVKLQFLCQKELTQSLLEDANGMDALIMYRVTANGC